MPQQLCLSCWFDAEERFATIDRMVCSLFLQTLDDISNMNTLGQLLLDELAALLFDEMGDSAPDAMLNFFVALQARIYSASLITAVLLYSGLRFSASVNQIDIFPYAWFPKGRKL